MVRSPSCHGANGARIVKEADDSEKAASSDHASSVAQNPSVKSVHEARGA